MKRSRGFTLVEMLVVIAIIALMAAILLPIFKGIRGSVYRHSCMSNLQKIYHALKMYYADWGYYPNSLYELHSGELFGVVERTRANPLQLLTPQEADLLKQKGNYPIFVSDFHCSANVSADSPLKEANGGYLLNLSYFNYDAFDPLLNMFTYSRVRTFDPNDPDYRKQLYVKEPLTSTVVTWCTAHRDLDPNGQPRSGSKDIVLFIDGHSEVRETSELLAISPVDGLPVSWRLEPRRR